MSVRQSFERIAPSDTVRQAHCAIQALSPPTVAALRGAAGSLPAYFIAHNYQSDPQTICVLTEDEEAAAYVVSDLEQILDPEQVVRFPRSDQAPYDAGHIEDVSHAIARGEALRRLSAGERVVLVASLEAVLSRVPSDRHVEEVTWTVTSGDQVDPQEAVARLMGLGFKRVEFAEAPGDVAFRGGILDVYPFAGTYPIRIEFFGDEVDSLREFDARTQRSVSRLTHARIVPNLETDESHFTSFFEYLDKDVLIVTFNEGLFEGRAAEAFTDLEKKYEQAQQQNPENVFPEPSARYLTSKELIASLLLFKRLQAGTFLPGDEESTIKIESDPQPVFNKSIELVRKTIATNARQGIRTMILCDSYGQLHRLQELLEASIRDHQLELSIGSIHRGFELKEAGLAVYTDHQIFDRYHRPTSRKRKRSYGGLTLRDIQNLDIGDFVVHVDFGIGKFAGLHRITVREKQQEAVKLLFRDKDVLYVNVNALHKLHKFTGKEGHQPTLTKLGTGQWERTKARTKKRVKDIARDLIELYAKRKASNGFAFSSDTIWQREMEASFRYEDTPDQAATVEAVKQDMQEPYPMDRLVCGDVGFGKTEIAIRAAFKAVQDGKQVAVLVPTTILAEQHQETFEERLAEYPVRIDALSRFRSQAQQKKILEQVRKGAIDIVIGTHRLISKDVRFKDLGLLVVDEEQRFGVAAKERLRSLRAEVDTLTLTATPIPRTLQFSLLGARDLSIINTPPRNRQPIVTEIHGYNKDLIRDAIQYETSRGGQVYFIHNRVRSIEEVATSLRGMLPNIRIRTAHGQMDSRRLEQVMADFVDGDFDVLVSTNIIESGLDIPNANTIIINNADRFGLAELHQLRGRVGRSDRKAFCYLLVKSVHGITREAQMRLQAVEEFSDLGSGFNIAMRDLDIRGAGNLLGGEQSGFIDEVGFETYHKILDDAVAELRDEEFAEVFAGQKHVPRAQETQVDVEEDAFIPDSYLSNNVERLNVYRRISEADTIDALDDMRLEILDRFGPIPEEVENLLRAARIRLMGQSLRLTKVLYKNQRLFLYPPSEKDDPYFYEHLFYTWLEKLNDLDRRYVLRDEKGKRLRAIVQDVPTLRVAIEVMERLQFEAEVVTT